MRFCGTEVRGFRLWPRGERRYWLGVQVEKVADWLKYPARPECAVAGCGYVETSGVHESPRECVACLLTPARVVEHHGFVHPRWHGRLIRRLNFVRS